MSQRRVIVEKRAGGEIEYTEGSEKRVIVEKQSKRRDNVLKSMEVAVGASSKQASEI